MQWLEGVTLDRLLRRDEPLSLVRVNHIADGVGRALEALHSQRCVHRDIRPSNILVSGDTIKLLDGIARTVSESSGDLRLGAIPYLAPEQLTGGEATPRTDLFSMGVVLFELLTGRHPFARSSAGETLHAIAHETPPAAHELRPELTSQISAVIARALSQQPAQRFATAREMTQALARATANVLARPHERKEELLDERFKLVSAEFDGTLTPSQAARLAAVEGEIAAIEREEFQASEPNFADSPAGRLEANLDRLASYVATLGSRPE